MKAEIGGRHRLPLLGPLRGVPLLGPLRGAIVIPFHPGGIARYRGLNHRLMALNPPGSLLIVVPKDLHPSSFRVPQRGMRDCSQGSQGSQQPAPTILTRMSHRGIPPQQEKMAIRNWTGVPFNPNMPRSGEAKPWSDDRLRDSRSPRACSLRLIGLRFLWIVSNGATLKTFLMKEFHPCHSWKRQHTERPT
jgi:hypothetical protein